MSAITNLTVPNDWLRISYSSLNTFANCARRFEFSKLYPRRARDYDTFAADVGKALHRGYQHYLVHRDEEKAIWAMMEVYPYEAEWNQDNDWRSLETCVVVMQEMIESAAMAEWRVAELMRPDGMIVPAIEVPFELRLDGIVLPDGRGIAVTGFVDAFLRNIMTERFRTIDIKTHRRFLRDATAKYKYDTQQVPYGIVLEHIQGKAIDGFEVLYLDTFVDLAEPRVELYAFEKDDDSVQEWLMNTVIAAQQIQRFMEMDYFPRTASGCLNFNKPCFFLDVCEIRDRRKIEAWLLEGEAPEHKDPETPWVTAHIDVFGNQKEAA